MAAMSSVLQLALLAILLTAVPSAGRFAVWNSTMVAGRGMSEQQVLAVDLMQYHHIASPVAIPDLSLAQRVAIAVQSSRIRAQYLNSRKSSRTGSETTLQAKDVFTSPVYSDQGSYLMKIQLGTPARTFITIADTGSDLVWVQCAPCTRCFSQPDAFFNPSSSSSYSAVPCTNALCSALPSSSRPCSSTNTCLYSYGYGDKSTTSGNFAFEKVTLTTTNGASQSFGSFGFGCGTNNQGTFGGTDGLVGLGQGPLSIVSQLGSQFGKVFSYCLVDFYSATTKTSPLLFGSAGPSALVYTPLVANPIDNPTFYYVNVVGITVNGVALKYPSGALSLDAAGNGGFILDSGTTITQLDSRVYTPLVNSLKPLIRYTAVDGSSQGFDLCYDLSKVASPVFPTVVFQFQNLAVTLPAANLFLEVDDQSTYCLAIQGSDLGISIYGNVQQQNFQIAYDIANRRVGFAAKTC